MLLCLLAIGTARAAEDPQRFTISADGHPLALWAKVPEKPRRVMVLVHGRTWSARPDFDLQVPGEKKSLMDGLKALGVATYAVDLRGYGGSSRDLSGYLTPDRAAQDLAAVARWVAERHPSLPAPVLFGWSYGALVAQLTAQRHGELLSGLVLFGYPARPGFDVTPEGLDGPPPRRPTTAAAAREDFIVDGTISDVAVEAFVAAALAADPVRMDWRELEQWQALDAAAVTTPTLLLEGAHDPLARDDVHSEFFAAVGTSDKIWVVLPRGDHAAFLEDSRPYFLALIEAFLLKR